MPTDKRERQRANREQARERQLREARRAKLIKNGTRFGGVALVVIVIGFLFSLGNDDAPPETVAATTTPTTPPPTSTTVPSTEVLPDDAVNTPEYLAFRALPVACGGDLPPPATALTFDDAGDEGIDPAADIRATLKTSCGDIVIKLDPAVAPKTVNSFVFLSRQGYYDGTVSHRIVPGFVYQAGDPTARGTGGPGYQYEDELPPADFTYTRGTVAMANSGPDTNGSQFFIVFQDATLGPDFTVFGQVESGLDVLDRIEAVPVTNQQPQEAVFIESIDIEG